MINFYQKKKNDDKLAIVHAFGWGIVRGILSWLCVIQEIETKEKWINRFIIYVKPISARIKVESYSEGIITHTIFLSG